jgi:hypothetical protein
MMGWHFSSRSPWWLGLLIGASACLLSVPPWRSLIEQSMLWHMAVQMPLLVTGGFMLARTAIARHDADSWSAWNRYGLTGFFASQLLLVYWMLPLAVDRAIVVPQADVSKLLSLLACGALLADSFKRSPAVLQLFFVGYAASMLLSTGVFLATSERRLCNAYSLEAQVAAGWAVAIVGLLLAGVWGITVGADSRRRVKMSNEACDQGRGAATPTS